MIDVKRKLSIDVGPFFWKWCNVIGCQSLRALGKFGELDNGNRQVGDKLKIS